MSRHIQVTFDAHDPRALSTFWRDVLGYVHPGPPGIDLPEGADPLEAWDEFLDRIGVPKEQHTRSAIEDPDGNGPRVFFQQVPEGKRGESTTDFRDHLDMVLAGWNPDQKVEPLRWIGGTFAADGGKKEGVAL